MLWGKLRSVFGDVKKFEVFLRGREEEERKIFRRDSFAKMTGVTFLFFSLSKTTT